MVATLEDARAIAMALPRTTEGVVKDHVKFRVGRIVYAAVSPDEERIGFGYPREQREGLIASDPGKFMLPVPADMRYQWVRARLPLLGVEELREFLIDAWSMCVSKKTADAYFADITAG